jgi:hypothetical protein
MKKILIMLLVLIVSFGVYANDIEIGYNAAGVSNSVLYPEGDYSRYPSRMTGLEQKLLQFNPEVALNNLGNTVDTLPDGNVNEGGTYTSSNSTVEFGVDGMYFTPLSDAFFLGIILDTYFSFDTLTNTEDDGYTTAGETVTNKRMDNAYTVTPIIIAAFKLGDLDLGVRVRSYNNFDTAEELFTQTTDTTQIADGSMFYTGGIIQSGSYYNGINGNISLGGSTNRFDWGAGLSGSYYVNSTTRYRAYDSDGDGFRDTIATVNDYQVLSAADGGAGDAYYDEFDEVMYGSLGLNGFMEMELANDKLLILTMNWTPYDEDIDRTYVHNATSDKDETVFTTSSNLLNFTVNGGLEIPVGSRSSFRLGTGIDFVKTTRVMSDLDVNGDSTYNILNTNSYDEVVYLTDPANGDIIDDASYASESYDLLIPLRISFRFKPAKTVTLFSSLYGSITYSSDVYNVFDTWNDQIWTESTSSFGFDVSSVALFTGIEFEFNDNAMLIMGTSLYPFSTNLDIDGDNLPESGDVETSDTTNPNNSDTNFDFSLDITFTFRY